ncbi:hypothetical protein CO655_26460 [Rhizobium sp. M1]|nr:hypothetical protein CO655_26460 [Rhizobium sp. M1]PDT37955.1 hypothetical protein CO671_07430 [Rhizobium sp. M10]
MARTNYSSNDADNTFCADSNTSSSLRLVRSGLGGDRTQLLKIEPLQLVQRLVIDLAGAMEPDEFPATPATASIGLVPSASPPGPETDFECL